jgi:HK97 family phage major capsid protein
MNEQELKDIIDSTVKTSVESTVKTSIDAAIAPLMETQRKYAEVFDKPLQVEVKEKPEAGIKFARMAKMLILSNNDPEKALNYASGGQNSSKGIYPEDKDLHKELKALSATTPSEGGFLIQESYAADVIPLLLSKIAVFQLGIRRVPMPNGNLNLPKLTGGATSYYQGENQNATKSQQTFGNIKMSSKKLVTLVPISNDLLRTNSIEADRLVRDDMVQQMALKMDYTALYGSGTDYTPRGIAYQAGISTSSSTGIITADNPASMLGILMANNSPMNSVGWVFNGYMWTTLYNLKTTTNQYIYRDEMSRGTLLGKPFKVSNQIPTATAAATIYQTDIFLGDWSELMFGEELAFEMMASKEASWYDGSSLQSAFSLDQTVLKVTAKHDMALRHAESFLRYQYAWQ